LRHGRRVIERGVVALPADNLGWLDAILLGSEAVLKPSEFRRISSAERVRQRQRR
jgi:hypothetical protein